MRDRSLGDDGPHVGLGLGRITLGALLRRHAAYRPSTKRRSDSANSTQT